jgi:hypothetical protein
VFHFLYRSNGGLCRRIHHDDNGSNNAVEASNFANKAEPFLQKDRRQDGCNDHRQCSKRRNENSINESVGDEIADLSDYHECHACPPVGVLEISITFSRLFVVFCIGLKKTSLLQNKRDTNKHTGRNGKDQANGFVNWWTSSMGGTASSSCGVRSGNDMVGLCQDFGSDVHVVCGNKAGASLYLRFRLTVLLERSIGYASV